jgi:hypothetical protein
MTDPDIVLRLRALANALAHGEWLALTATCKTAADEIERLRKERDEARREVCNMMHKTGFLNGDYAHSRGWDCFKEDFR